MKNEILKELYRLEKEMQIKILYAVESGSRAWGFSSENSDWDVRFIYIHKPEWYLSINKKKDNYEKILPNMIDLGGWDIRKALKLFQKSNPPLMEWLRSPVIYVEDGSFAENLRELSAEFFNPVSAIYHYLHMAGGNLKDYLLGDVVKTKKYFYVLRPLLACRYVEKYNRMAPVEFEKLVKEIKLSDEISKEIFKLLDRKRGGGELQEGPKNKILNEFLENELEYFSIKVREYNQTKLPDIQKPDQLFRDILKTTWPGYFK